MQNQIHLTMKKAFRAACGLGLVALALHLPASWAAEQAAKTTAKTSEKKASPTLSKAPAKKTAKKTSIPVSTKEYASYKVFTCEHFDYCPYFSPVFLHQPNVKKLLMDAFTFSKVEAPYWLRKGVENSTLPVRYQGVDMLFGSTTEPGNSLNGMRFLYTPKTQRVVGVWLNHNDEPIWIGDIDATEKKILNDYITEEGDLFAATEQTRAMLPIEIR